MSNLTKVFVVLVTILSAMLVAVVVTFVASQDNLKGETDALKTRVQIAQESAISSQHELTTLQQKNDEQNANLRNRAANLQAELNARMSEVAALKSNLVKARGGNERLQVQQEAHTAQISTLASLTDRMDSELGNLRQSLRTSQSSEIEASQQLMAANTKVQALEREVRKLKEEVTALNNTALDYLELLRRAGITPQDERTSAGVHESDVPIHGSVTAVAEAAGDVYAGVNVGRNDGVNENMKFMVFRGDAQLVGTLVIDVVDERTASGVVTLLVNPDDQVMSGDRVLSGEVQ